MKQANTKCTNNDERWFHSLAMRDNITMPCIVDLIWWEMQETHGKRGTLLRRSTDKLLSRLGAFNGQRWVGTTTLAWRLPGDILIDWRTSRCIGRLAKLCAVTTPRDKINRPPSRHTKLRKYGVPKCPLRTSLEASYRATVRLIVCAPKFLELAQQLASLRASPCEYTLRMYVGIV